MACFSSTIKVRRKSNCNNNWCENLHPYIRHSRSGGHVKAGDSLLGIKNAPNKMFR